MRFYRIDGDKAAKTENFTAAEEKYPRICSNILKKVKIILKY